MPEIRYDPIKWRWIIISPERGRRPEEYILEKEEIPKPEFCPFCPGHENSTPPEVFAIRPNGGPPNSSGWIVRVISNKFPALRVEEEVWRRGESIYDVICGTGAHEVIIETHDHAKTIYDMSQDDWRYVFISYRERIRDLEKDKRLRYFLIFKNYKKEAGISLTHPHSQLIAGPVVPPVVRIELDSAREHYRKKERCIFCDILINETEKEKRVIYDDGNFLAFCPFTSAFPFEVWLFPKKHIHNFSVFSDFEISNLASSFSFLLPRYKEVLGDVPMNFVFHNAPPNIPRAGHIDYWSTIELDYHFHIEFIPRITRFGGFEIGGGIYINPTPPEIAASYMKKPEQKNLKT